MARLPKLPKLLDRKIYKTGQTRGADDDQIFQNRVGRNSTVLIPFAVWVQIPIIRPLPYENGFIVLVPPREYFEIASQDISEYGLEIGVNALVYYERRDEWLQFHPDQYGYNPPVSRIAPLGGHYAARIANTTSENDARINVGFTSTGLKGAGIRLYEYADSANLGATRIQLEAVCPTMVGRWGDSPSARAALAVLRPHSPNARQRARRERGELLGPRRFEATLAPRRVRDLVRRIPEVHCLQDEATHCLVGRPDLLRACVAEQVKRWAQGRDAA